MCRPDNLSELSRTYQNLKIEYMTAHKSKGSEADYVVILDLTKGKYGFPSQINTDPILDRVLPGGDDFLHAEERRLFYVALTRARRRVFLLTQPGKESDFVQELGHDDYDVVFSHQELAARAIENTRCPECLTGRLLKRDGRRSFFGCSLYPRCRGTVSVCPQCGNAPLVRLLETYQCANPDCDHSEPTCPRCRTGRLQKKNGKNGKFWGCSNYRKNSENSCRATFSMETY